jgi:hypothetical protein
MACVPRARLVVEPTATQLAADRHDTSIRELDRESAGFGVAVTRYLPSAHFSARERAVVGVLARLPTAMQRAGLVHDTPNRIVAPARAAAGTEAAAVPGSVGMASTSRASAGRAAASAAPGRGRVSMARRRCGMR